MKTMDELWKERVRDYIKELQKYMKYMFNDHLLFVLIFGGGAAIYYYSQWVKTLDSSFPVAIIMAILLAVILSASPISTLLKEADLVFLLPLETKMQPFFKKGRWLSFLTQAYLILLVLAVCMPMFVQVTGKGYKWFFYLLIITVLLKYWNLLIHWWMLKITAPYSLWYDWLIRFTISGLLLYFILEAASFWFIGAVLFILAAFTVYIREAAKNKGIKWELLIEKEQARMQAFYHAANMFTDVPHLKGRVKRRSWLDSVFSSIPYGHEQTFRFLYARALVRTSEYSGLIVRLSLISALIILFSGSLYLSLAISLLFLYLTGFQLFPLLRRYELKIWTSLYPIDKSQKSRVFLQLLFKILLIQALFFGVCAWIGGDILQGAIVAGVSILFSILFSKMYAPKRIKKLLFFP
ncbi:ABC transporter permease [Lederbergia sp. NSJ-179]|uniref:ABC transporter permease n=1 Tax=Lederbergia sp. NSJ-179 TaxID=2931402 RepID=UPI001FD411D7|nr:ABC transporter permease [Lederbergia sp. NSJ-179]MCJ7840413.1 ABC transporter permease [Lederbergia sp. NSJ-179]